MLPTGIITIWSGAVVDIPAGWTLCDGTAGTPDLRDRFIVGAGAAYNPDDTGGTLTHTHTGTTDGHAHHLSPSNLIGIGATWDDDTDIRTDTFTTDPANHLPCYYALAYIMKT